MPNRVWLILCVELLGCGGPQGSSLDLPRTTPGLELQTEDFAHARAGFATKLVRKGPSPSPGEVLAPLADAEEIEYQSADLRLRAYRSRPSADGVKRPAVLLLHGGFAFGIGHWEKSRPFRDAGFVVMMPVLRGENGQAGSFSLFYHEVNDVLATVEVLATMPDVDPRNLFVAGHSVGGTLAMLAAMASPRFRAAVSLSGSPDLSSYLRVSHATAPFDTSDDREIRLRSPVAYATSFKCPVRLFCGDEEFWVQSSTLRTAMLAKAVGIDVEAVEVPGDHFSSMPEAIRRSIEFFRRMSFTP
jgi:dipeptidyl aminopeptidase/acylaminoacyl peptidase